MNPIANISQQFAAQNYKLTPQREAIVKVLLDNEEEHLSVEEVYMRVKTSYPHLGLATVYRTLELLCELHIVEKMNFGDGVARYDLRDDHAHMHHHLICNVCGRLEEIKEDWLLELERRLEVEYGFKVTDHRLDFKGTYKTCKQNGCKADKQKQAVS
ncbi:MULTISPECIES: Fur family transcriptional regulator [Paenibacillus]|jgi:Fur family ferric uptake transcriptional regulator|uniref:Transcriptional repressor n=1 Tax=Paenibacillus borealis TaxID=160799 RepID=A0ABX3H2R5_PAEBO|nr:MULTISPECIES: transcriptional repressor [Paenibacillus]AIQ17935.1 Fur family transcriptional regulator [Paenibacillus sp. FSL H7-0357]OMD44710.1 transcriptional repressor [Paenibacillus borealis]